MGLWESVAWALRFLVVGLGPVLGLFDNWGILFVVCSQTCYSTLEHVSVDLSFGEVQYFKISTQIISCQKTSSHTTLPVLKSDVRPAGALLLGVDLQSLDVDSLLGPLASRWETTQR